MADETAITAATIEIPVELADEALRVLATWARSERIPEAWQMRMSSAAARLHDCGARSAGEPR